MNALLKKVIYLFEVSFANTKHLCSVSLIYIFIVLSLWFLIVLHSIWSYAAD